MATITNQAKVLMMFNVAAILMLAFVPKAVGDLKLYDTDAEKWGGVAASAVGMAVATAAVQCSVVGGCNLLAWGYVAFVGISTVLMFGLFLLGAAVSKELNGQAATTSKKSRSE